jgi:Zn-finger nucleic acid-binding protein/ribosomal protein L40E
VRLVACSSCHAQYDVSGIEAKTFPCRCGEIVENRPLAPRDSEIHRCAACGALAADGADQCSYCNAVIVRDPSQSWSLICPECYARNAEDGRFCTACGVTFSPYPVRVAGHELPCPVCTMLMPAREAAGVALNECGSCNGLWVPGDEIDTLVRRASEARLNAGPESLASLAPRTRGANPAAQKVQYRRCPECESLMHRQNFRKASGVIIDRCSAHGTWLDADELEQIAGFILSGRQPAAVLTAEPEPLASKTPENTAFRVRGFGTSSSDRGIRGLESLVETFFALLK